MTTDSHDSSPMGRRIAGLRDDGDGGDHRDRDRLRAKLFGRPVVEIGRYRLGDRLGQGGQGQVYTAWDDALDRKIALKLVLPEREEDGRSRALMLREAKTLAMLSHPNVVQVYEVGEHEDQIYIAMEHIEGTSLKGWLSLTRRRWPAVLQRFLDAGRGLAAIHRTGLVHRDFKPANVLIGEDGRVCVADFGLAKPVSAMPSASSAMETTQGSREGSGAERTAVRLSKTGVAAGTPAYMAPEQIRGQPLDARADQFSFCVALYEGLYGRRPFTGETLGAMLVGMDDGVLPPPRGSKVPKRLWRALARGLAMEPDARFESMEALLRALDPARARRHRNLALGAVAAVTMTATTVVLALPDDPCPRPEVAELGWSDDARQRVREALLGTRLTHAEDTASRVLAQLDERVDQLAGDLQQACEATRVQRVQTEALLDQQAFCLRGVEGRVRAVVDALAEADAEAADRAVETVGRLPRSSMCVAEGALFGMAPPSSETQAEAVKDARRRLARVRATLELGHVAEARAALDDQAPAIEAIDYAPLSAELRHMQGQVRWRSGQPVQALDPLARAAELAQGSRHDLLAAEVFADLTFLSYSDLTPDDVARWLPLARASVHRIGSPPELVTRITHFEGELALGRGEHEQARSLLERAVAEHAEQGDPLAEARATGSLASVHTMLDEPERALALHHRERLLYVEHYGPRHPQVAFAEYNIGKTLVELGRYPQARDHLKEAIALWSERHGPGHLRLAMPHVALQQVALVDGTLAQAMEHAQEALRLRRLGLPEDHTDVAEAEMVVGVTAFFAGDLDLAIDHYRVAWQSLSKALGPDDPNVALARANLAEALVAAGRVEEARGHAEPAWERLHEVLPEHPASSNALKVRGQIALRDGDSKRAVELVSQALALLQSGGTAQPLELGDAELWLARALEADGRTDEARRAAERAEQAFSELPGELGRRGAARARAMLSE